MPLHIVMGRPGGGKSYWGLRTIRDRLIETDQHVITNLPVNVGELNAHIQEKYPDKTIDVVGRVRLLDDATETRHFYAHRPRGWSCVVPSVEEQSRREFPLDYSKLYQPGDYDRSELESGAVMTMEASALGGVFYVIDEAHLFYGARDWAKLGKAVVYYMSQHRKLGDTVMMISQFPGQIDKQFRGLAQDFTVVRNLSYEKVGVFKSLSGKFIHSHYLELPNSQQKPMETGLITLDVSGLGKCYETAKGVGMGGGTADTDHAKSKGLPLWSVFLFLGVLLLFVFTVPGMLVQKTIFPGKSKPEQVQPAETIPESTPSVVEPERQAESLPVPGGGDLEEKPLPETEKEPVYLIGMVMLPGPKVIIHLSDGRKLTEKSRELQFVHKDWVLVDGEKITSPPYGWKKKDKESSGFAGFNQRTLKR